VGAGPLGRGGDREGAGGLRDDGEEAEEDTEYRTLGDLRRERLGLEEEERERLRREGEGKSFEEEVDAWGAEFATSQGAARRFLGSLALNLTDRHYDALGPPGLSKRDVRLYSLSHTHCLSHTHARAHTHTYTIYMYHMYKVEYLEALLRQGREHAGCVPGCATLPRLLVKQLIHELHKFESTSVISMAEHLKEPLEETFQADHLADPTTSDHNLAVLRELGKELAREQVAQFPLPSEDDLVRFKTTSPIPDPRTRVPLSEMSDAEEGGGGAQSVEREGERRQ
jgi:hypothetical protein